MKASLLKFRACATRSAHFTLDPTKLGTLDFSRMHVAAPTPGSWLAKYEASRQRFAR